jgi:hypothetical protein
MQGATFPFEMSRPAAMGRSLDAVLLLSVIEVVDLLVLSGGVRAT